MNLELYKAATKGEIQPFEHIQADVLDDLVMIPTNNTILHTNIIFQDPQSISPIFVEEILWKCPSLLLKVNADGDTALHIAAKFGCVSIVEVLIRCAKDSNNHVDSEPTVKEMLRMANNDGNTSLHLAVQFDYKEVVKRLIEEDREYMYLPNSYGKPPLYVAIERDVEKMVKLILDGCSSITYEGPDGMTALHIAAFQYYGHCYIPNIIEKRGALTKATDKKGWTPLHHAVYVKRDLNVEHLLKHDASAACIPDSDRKITPLHIAAGHGNVRFMDMIVSQCRECCEMVDNRVWNYLHFAVLSLHIKKLEEYIEANPLVSYRLMEQTDMEGNTPLHLCASLHGMKISPIWRLIKDRRLLLHNKQNQSISSLVAAGGDPDLKKKHAIKALEDEGVLHVWKEPIGQEDDIERMNKTIESKLVVAALIATVTFTAALTVPGGYESENDHPKGFAILSTNRAFQTFIISDTIALLFSVTAVFIYFMISNPKVLKNDKTLYYYASVFTMIAMAAMILAFVTGTYAVLAHSLWLAILTCVLGLSFFGIVFGILYKVMIKNVR